MKKEIMATEQDARQREKLLRQDIEKLSEAYQKALNELFSLREANYLLEQKLLQSEEVRKKYSAAAYRAKKESARLQQQCDKLNWKILRQENAFRNLQVRYDSLANSKLGKSTLSYWAWKKKKQEGGSGGRSALSLPAASQTAGTQLSALATGDPAQQEAAQEKKLAELLAMPKSMEISQEQTDWYEQYEDAVRRIPDSNGIRFYQRLPVKIGIICDEFFFQSISAAADFIYVTPENWRERLDEGIDAFLFVSLWQGIDRAWAGAASLSDFGSNSHRTDALELLKECRRRGIPTIFYSKEDPPNYELFLEYAQQCDYIFTSAAECIPYYQEDCVQDHVEAVCFGINPEFHNPIGFYREKKEDCVLFSGSWMRKYPERCVELARMFDGVLDAGRDLHIIDRNYPSNKNYIFPDPYLEYVSPALPHDILQKVHKLFDWAINVNTVQESDTMFANRTFELQANGVLMMSNFSVGMNSMLPTIMVLHDSFEVAGMMNSLSAEERYERQITGIRSVMTGHTCFDRVAQLLRPTGIPAEQPRRKVLVLTDDITENVRQCFDAQSYPDRELMNESEATVRLLCNYDMVTWFAPDAEYGDFYLEDMVNGFKYTACDYITKDAWYEGRRLHSGVEHNYVTRMGSKYRTVFWRKAYSPEELLGLLGNSDEKKLPNGYSIDHLSYNAKPSQKRSGKKKQVFSVVVPVFNNGLQLYGKCFLSLRRSSVFQQIEIILVDDGSTDERTLHIENELVRQYENVVLYRFSDGGSGSASRPRNKGVELATTEYITFLDPDNEAVCDGYAQLYLVAMSDEADLVIGNMYKCDTEKRLADYYRELVQAAKTNQYDEGVGDLLVKSKFQSASIQAMMIRTEMVRELGLEQVVGAAGQDTLFSWQLLQNARRVRFVDLPIHIYYAQTTGSVTNAVGPGFFRKLLLLQKPKRDWLWGESLLDGYMKTRHNYYAKNWVLKKLSQVEPGEAEECAVLVEEILKVYELEYDGGEPIINEFLEQCEKKKYAEAVDKLKEVFPENKKRPMPTLDEIFGAARQRARIQAEYEQKGGRLFFDMLNETEASDTFAWVVLLADGEYQKVYSGKYRTAPAFSYDFSVEEPGVYKVRAFIKKEDGKKISEDIVYVRVGEDRSVDVLKYQTKAKRKE